jgi:hypothetical protein
MSPVAVVLANFDGDNDLDLAVTNNVDNTVSILLNDGREHFLPAPIPIVATGAQPQSIAAGDLDGDGGNDRDRERRHPLDPAQQRRGRVRGRHARIDRDQQLRRQRGATSTLSFEGVEFTVEQVVVSHTTHCGAMIREHLHLESRGRGRPWIAPRLALPQRCCFCSLLPPALLHHDMSSRMASNWLVRRKTRRSCLSQAPARMSASLTRSLAKKR